MKKLLAILVLGLLLFYGSNAGSFGNNPGGFCYTGYGGPAYDGYGGPAYDGYGGPCYDGYGGPAYSGYGGPCYKTPTGFFGNCPKACISKACKK